MSSGLGTERQTAKPIPERIREAREARGYSAESFAERLGVTRQAVAQYETGQASPSGEVMRKIVAETAQPVAFFTTMPPRAGEPKSPFFRSLKRMEQQQRKRIIRRLQWAGDITTMIGQFIDLPQLSLPTVWFDADRDDVEEIEAAAEALRDHWNLGRGPIRDLAEVLERHGVILVRERVDCLDMDAVSCWIGGRAFVLLSAEVTSGPRDKFNLAHELGHLVMHSDVEITSENLDRIERQANRFASAFLMPAESFSREVLGTSIDYFLALKERWGVAIAAMAYRCRDLNILSENQFSYIFRQMNARKIRKVEPLDDRFPVAKPNVLQQGIEMLVEHGVFTRDQIESSLSMNMSDVETLSGVEPGYLDRRVVKLSFSSSQ
ncbi:MAG: ImmA/IrrE family metallo-endopeptidase [Caulobacter sp.]|nr:ImmA/IrrE family metallo-endopeptidase [Caulobacter sp.]